LGKKTKTSQRNHQPLGFHCKRRTLYLLTTNNFVWLDWSPISLKPSTSSPQRTSSALGFPTHTSQVQNLWRRTHAKQRKRRWNLGRRRRWNLGRRRRSSECETRAGNAILKVKTYVFTWEGIIRKEFPIWFIFYFNVFLNQMATHK